MTNWTRYLAPGVGRTLQTCQYTPPAVNAGLLIGSSDNWAANDVAGNYSVTLVDVLDTFVVMGDVQGFDTAVKNVIKSVSFNVNTRPQVFEATIRVLGGLLSAHIFATRPNQPFYLPWYKDELLHMAHDLGNRLLPAFSTSTGIPYARVSAFGPIYLRVFTHRQIHLKLGVLQGEGYETCMSSLDLLDISYRPKT